MEVEYLKYPTSGKEQDDVDQFRSSDKLLLSLES
jgi:hypothetical protein